MEETNNEQVERPEPGLPAIHPHLPSVPSFTEDDVRNYINSHSVASMRIYAHMRIGIQGKPIVSQVQFLTNHEVTHFLHGANPGLLDEQIVCFVKLVGNFSFHPPTFGKKTISQFPLHHIYQVYDAKTGNLLMESTYGN